MPNSFLKKLRALCASSKAGGKNSLRLGVLARNQTPFLKNSVPSVPPAKRVVKILCALAT